MITAFTAMICARPIIRNRAVNAERYDYRHYRVRTEKMLERKAKCDENNTYIYNSYIVMREDLTLSILALTSKVHAVNAVIGKSLNTRQKHAP
jgi:hypothetical protein